ncbi:CLUMA_CG004409, isoform A [Clunio marinus]|uniref:CLUMA_CG004409, isoform A n=1 Tax=Clunio marinus TaxID=568069 RepID=A0A1J1HTK8_9DIPT|nr:CLUMA_CG004409, isoform A [Clunio marinus]
MFLINKSTNFVQSLKLILCDFDPISTQTTIEKYFQKEIFIHPLHVVDETLIQSPRRKRKEKSQKKLTMLKHLKN